VLALNNEDGGNRKVILIQQPYDTKENEAETFNICRKVTAERVRRVIKGYSYKTQSGKREKVAGTGGSFSYARLSDKSLFGEYRDFGENPPPYEEIAKYIFYTETSRQWNRADMDKKSGRIGEHNGTSYYLLYSPNQKADWAIDAEFLKTTAANDANNRLVVYAEKIWLHRSALREWEAANGKTVRTMIVPFNLR
jgi:adenine-specific DNA-methyltransferase